MKYGPSFKSVFLSLLVLLIGAKVHAQIVFNDPGFTTETVVTLPQYAPVGFRFAPDGRLFIWEKTGIVKIFKNGNLLPTPFLDFSTKVNRVNDRGMLGLALDPEFTNNGYVYLLYTYENTPNPDDPGAKTARLTRVKADPLNPDVMLANSEIVILGSIGTPPCDNYPTGSDCIASDGNTHTIGTVEFAPDGKLFVSIGDGAPPSLNSQALRAQDLYSYSGKILRIWPDGSAPGDNPFDDGTNSIRSKVWAYGVRQPFRFGLHPTLGEPYWGDVGWNSWEEINRGRGGNFGWPCYEGINPQPQYQANYVQCQNLPPSAVVPPIHTYNHSVGRSSIGGTFYTGTVYPDTYQGNFFFSDYSNNWIKRITFDQNEAVVSVLPFATNTGGTVHMQVGPDGLLYLVNINTGLIVRVNYNGPSAVASATPTSGYSPLNVSFSSAGSSNPQGGALTYLWDFGDGNTSTLPDPSHTYTAPAVQVFNAKLTVTNSGGVSSSDTVKITVGSVPPTATISTPTDGAVFQTGQTVNYAGSATDTEDGTLPSSSLYWTVLLHHDNHTHTYLTAQGSSGSFVVDEHDGDSHYHYEMILTAIDSSGLSNFHLITLDIDVIPAASTLTFVPNPVTGGTNSTGTVTLSIPARPGGETVSVSSNKPEVQVPSTVLIPQDAISQNFTATTSSVSNPVNVTITAVLNATVQTTLTVNPLNFPPTSNMTAPLNGASYIDPANITLKAKATDSDGSVTKVEFYSGTTLIATDTTSPYQATYSNVIQGNYALTAKSYDNTGGSTTSASINIAVHPASFAIPSPWLQADIGGPAGPGNAFFSNSSFTVSAAGFDIWSTSDSFHYVYQLLSGDMEIVARVASIQNTNSWAKSGVMIRETLAANSSHASMLLTPGNGMNFQHRVNTGGSSSNTVGGAASAPYWVKLTRVGNTFTSAKSTDGTNWTVVGSVTITMSPNVYIGLALTSHNNAALCASVLDNVTVTGSVSTNNPPAVTITSPANGAAFAAPATIDFAADASDSDGAIVQVDFYANGSSVGSDTTSPYAITWSNVAAGAYSLTARATDDGGLPTTSNAVTITVQPPGGALPPPWQKSDIGSVGVAGNASYLGGVFTVNGSGSDIWSSVDAFHYVYQTMSGNGDIIARVASQQNTDPWAKAGVMIRNTLTAGSAHATMLITPTNGLAFQRRITSPGSSSTTAGGAGTTPYWVKVSRAGNIFTGSKSVDGINWTVVGSATITMATNVYIGLAVTSHNNSVVSACAFDNVSVSANPPGNNPPTVSITSPANGAIFTAPASFNIDANASDTDGTITQVEFFSGSTSLGIDTSSPYSVPYNNVPAGTYNLTAKATDNVGAYMITNPVTITVQPPGGSLPPPWLNQDIGTVGIPGNASYSGGALTITASGSDIWTGVDSFHFVHQPLDGDGQIVARIASLQNTNSWAKAGVMIRQSLTSTSPNAIMLITPVNGLRLQSRVIPSGNTTDIIGGTGVAPYWVKLVRSGDNFTGYRSVDGINWILVGSATITMPTNVYIGLAHTSHNNGVLGSAVVDNVSVTP